MSDSRTPVRAFVLTLADGSTREVVRDVPEMFVAWTKNDPPRGVLLRGAFVEVENITAVTMVRHDVCRARLGGPPCADCAALLRPEAA